MSFSKSSPESHPGMSFQGFMICLSEIAIQSSLYDEDCVVSIAHGSNDVSNAVGPFTAIAHIHATGQIPRGGAAPVWVLMCGGVGIVAGLGTYQK